MAVELDIRLGDLSVGRLQTDRNEHSEFRLHASYRAMYPRPVLGQIFEDNPSRVHTSTLRLPPFFSNLLPEGSLRELIARQIGVKEIRKSYLLAHLGDDLAGAVRTVPVDGPWNESLDDIERDQREARDTATSRSGKDEEHTLRFSLAGIQLKFSMLQDGQRFTLPARGRDGDWIVKLPDSRFARVPHNEHSMLRWAAAAGIAVPESRIVPVSALEGLPSGIVSPEPHAVAIRRFDRNPDGSRVHQEDFAQIINVYPHQKYDKANYTSIGSIILRTAGEFDFEQFLDRLVFVVLSGNADAHLKNWSLRYADPFRACLAPAYDLVATILYRDAKIDDFLALNLSGSKRYEDVKLSSFARMAEKLRAVADAVEYDVGRIVARVQAAIDRIQDAWSMARDELLLDSGQRAAIERHWRRIPLLHGGGPLPGTPAPAHTQRGFSR